MCPRAFYADFLGAGLLFFGLLSTPSIGLADAKGRSVMLQVYQESRKHSTQESNVLLRILDQEKRERVRSFTSRRLLESPERSKSLIKFYRPPNVSGTSLLTHTDDAQNTTEQWIYFPALRNVRQLDTEGRNESFMGSDFTYADVAGRQIDQDEHTLLNETKTRWIIQSIPKDKTQAYSKLILLVDKKSKVPLRVVFYDRKGKKLKTLSNTKISIVKGMHLATNSVMLNHRSKGRSLLVVNEVKVGVNISQNDVGIIALKSN